ncbi:unnamed protein product [Urochloa decumbens]|uniref:Peptidase A1 domain-containing protein n=1 Tax=Urochloa decumbens TaxID=240449 RepID=A0ABC8XCW3_9POAL
MPPLRPPSPVRMQLIHTDAGLGLTLRELLQRMSLRSKARAARLLAEASGGAEVTPGAIPGAVPDTEYLVHFAVGTPPQAVQLTLDTGSDLIWTQCPPCASCLSFPQPLPYFDASASSTFAGALPCSSKACQALPITSCGTGADASPSPGNQTCAYGYSYGDGSVTIGILVSDTFTFPDAGAAVPDLAFGCGVNNTGIFKSNETGIAGFGRGALSLPSQLKADNFSYCFTDITGTAPSLVQANLPANLFSSDPAAVQTVTLIQNPASPSFYYLPLTGITVGSTQLSIPALTANGTGGTIIDSGTGMTSLPHDVYALVASAFVEQASLPAFNATSVSQLCFTVPAAGAKPDVPKLVLEFEGASVDLPRESYMFDIEDAGVSATCLAVNDGGGDTDTTIIGNYQQQNAHVLYDLANNKLSFVPAQCDKV